MRSRSPGTSGRSQAENGTPVDMNGSAREEIYLLSLGYAQASYCSPDETRGQRREGWKGEKAGQSQRNAAEDISPRVCVNERVKEYTVISSITGLCRFS